MRKAGGKKVLLRILPIVGKWLIRSIFFSCRIRFHGKEHWDSAHASGKPIVGSIWHYTVIGIFGAFRDEPFVMMVSASHDGDYLAKLAEKLGFSVVRGSRNNRAMQAMKELMRELKKGKHAGLVADGSQGPAMKVQPGALLLASRCDGLVMPMLWSATRYITFNSWDKMILPLPFSRVDFFIDEPYSVPKGIKGDELDEYAMDLEKKLNNLYKKAWNYQGKEYHWE